MKKRNLIVIANLLFCCLSAVSAQAQTNTFEGKRYIVNAVVGESAIRYSATDNYITVKKTDGTNPESADIIACPNSGLSVTVVASEIRVSTNANAYFCFRGSLLTYSIKVKNGTETQTFKYWIANPADGSARTQYNVRDFNAKGDGTNDDTEAIRSAIAYAASKNGGTVFFPPGDYSVSSTITLPPGIVIQGATSLPQNAPHNYLPYPLDETNYSVSNYTRINWVNSVGGAIFLIGENTSDVKIKNIVLRSKRMCTTDPCSVLSGSIGIKAKGKASENENYSSTSYLIGLTDVSFELLDIGFKVETTPTANNEYTWQFDFVKLDHCFFAQNKTAGIYVDTSNTEWRITNSFFYMTGAPDIPADGIVFRRGGAITIEHTFGVGSRTSYGGDFIKVDEIGALTVINSECEQVTRSLVANATAQSGSYARLVTLINNVFLHPIEFLEKITVISNGNFYGPETFNAAATARIYSMGDRFCYDAASGTYTGCLQPNKETIQSNPTANFKGGNIIFSTG